MKADKEVMPVDRRILLSALWIFVLFNLFWADFHAFITPGFLQEIMSGTVSGFQITENLLLFAALVHEIPVAMIVLSLLLRRNVNRWANIAAGALNLFFTISDGPTDPDHIFFRIVTALGLLLIIWFAWRWKKEEA
jgi:hypothetical protein